MKLHCFCITMYFYTEMGKNYIQVADYINAFSYQEAEHMLPPIIEI